MSRFATLQGVSEDMVTEHSSVYLSAFGILESILTEKQAAIVHGKVLAAVIIAHQREEAQFLDMIANTASIERARWLGRRIPCATLRKQKAISKQAAKQAVLDTEATRFSEI